MNISTRGEISTFLLGSELPDGSYIYLDQDDHKMYSTNPLEVIFNTSLEYAIEIFKRIVHEISITSNLLPGMVKPLRLFQIDGTKPKAIDAVVLDSYNTACHRTNQSFRSEYLVDGTRNKPQPVVEYSPFESNGYLDED